VIEIKRKFHDPNCQLPIAHCQLLRREKRIDQSRISSLQINGQWAMVNGQWAIRLIAASPLNLLIERER